MHPLRPVGPADAREDHLDLLLERHVRLRPRGQQPVRPSSCGTPAACGGRYPSSRSACVSSLN